MPYDTAASQWTICASFPILHATDHYAKYLYNAIPLCRFKIPFRSIHGIPFSSAALQ